MSLSTTDSFLQDIRDELRRIRNNNGSSTIGASGLLVWLQRVFQLQSSQLPTRIQTDSVAPVLEVGQGGFPGATYGGAINFQLGGSGAATLPLIAADPDNHTIVYSGYAENAGGAAAYVVEFSMTPIPDAGNVIPVRYSVPVDTKASWKDLNNSQPLWVPATVELDWAAYATGALENVTVGLAWVKIPKEFAPW